MKLSKKILIKAILLTSAYTMSYANDDRCNKSSAMNHWDYCITSKDIPNSVGNASADNSNWFLPTSIEIKPIGSDKSNYLAWAGISGSEKITLNKYKNDIHKGDTFHLYYDFNHTPKAYGSTYQEALPNYCHHTKFGTGGEKKTPFLVWNKMYIGEYPIIGNLGLSVNSRADGYTRRTWNACITYEDPSFANLKQDINDRVIETTNHYRYLYKAELNYDTDRTGSLQLIPEDFDETFRTLLMRQPKIRKQDMPSGYYIAEANISNELHSGIGEWEPVHTRYGGDHGMDLVIDQTMRYMIHSYHDYFHFHTCMPDSNLVYVEEYDEDKEKDVIRLKCEHDSGLQNKLPDGCDWVYYYANGDAAMYCSMDDNKARTFVPSGNFPNQQANFKILKDTSSCKAGTLSATYNKNTGEGALTCQRK